MKHLRQLCAGLLLVLALSVNALAGDIPSPPAPSDGTAESPGYTDGTAESPGYAGSIDTPGILAWLSSLL